MTDALASAIATVRAAGFDVVSNRYRLAAAMVAAGEVKS